MKVKQNTKSYGKINQNNSITPTQKISNYSTTKQKSIRLGYSLIIPTYNEPAICNLLTEIFYKCKNCEEIIVVDESTDHTPDIIEFYIKSNYLGKRIRLIERKLVSSEKDLSQSVLLGFRAAKCPYACVIDGDGQHDVLIPEKLYSILKDSNTNRWELVCYDIAIATRSPPYHKKFIRELYSLLGIQLAKLRIKTYSNDPLSGCFMCETHKIKDNIYLFDETKGYKILLDILKSGIFKRPADFPITLKPRTSGESKLKKKQIIQFIKQLLS